MSAAAAACASHRPGWPLERLKADYLLMIHCGRWLDWQSKLLFYWRAEREAMATSNTASAGLTTTPFLSHPSSCNLLQRRVCWWHLHSCTSPLGNNSLGLLISGFFHVRPCKSCSDLGCNILWCMIPRWPATAFLGLSFVAVKCFGS